MFETEKTNKQKYESASMHLLKKCLTVVKWYTKFSLPRRKTLLWLLIKNIIEQNATLPQTSLPPPVKSRLEQREGQNVTLSHFSSRGRDGLNFLLILSKCTSQNWPPDRPSVRRWNGLVLRNWELLLTKLLILPEQAQFGYKLLSIRQHWCFAF